MISRGSQAEGRGREIRDLPEQRDRLPGPAMPHWKQGGIFGGDRVPSPLHHNGASGNYRSHFAAELANRLLEVK